MVKSLLEESRSQLKVNSISACLPSVAISFRKVVISNFFLFITAVTVPCLIPVSITLILSLASLILTSSGSNVVAKSMSSILSPLSAFLTQPPTNLILFSFSFLLIQEKITCASFMFSLYLVVL